MKKAIATLALAGAIGVSGCASLNPFSSGGLDPNAVLLSVEATLKADCPILAGAVPTLQSIQALITAADPALVVVNSALVTGENFATAMCGAATAMAAHGGAKAGAHAPLFVDGVPVFFQ